MLSLPFFFMLIKSLKYVDAINILNLDYDLGTALGIGEFAGGILLTIILLVMATSLPIWKRNTTAIVLLSALVLFFGVAVAWISVFALVIIIALVTFGVVKTANDFLREHGVGR